MGILVLLVGFLQVSSVRILDLPKGDLKWSTERPDKAKFCVPAAFTSESGTIEGEYRLNGEIYNPNKRLKISIDDTTFYVDKHWHTDNGFQQLVLVYNNRVKVFKDNRRYIRRALCKKNEHVFLVESIIKMTLSEFAKECGKISSDAVYLDMGSYGYGYIKNKVLSPLAFFGKYKQTNWLYIQ